MFYKKNQQKEYFTHIHKKYNVNYYNSYLFISCEIVNYIGIKSEQEIYSSYNTTNFPYFYDNAT